MRTTYEVRPAVALEGQLHGACKKTLGFVLADLPQINQGVIASSEAGDWVFTVTDLETSQVFSLTVEVSGATEATTLDELVAAWQNSPLRNLASIAEDGVDTWTTTFRNGGRQYSVVSDPPGSMTDTITEVQGAGGTGVEVGRFVRRVDDNEFEALIASSTVEDIAGVLYRTDGNHFHSLENDSSSATDRVRRGKNYPLLREGYVWMVTEDSVTPSSSVYVRRAQTSGAGTVGRVRGSAVGGQQVYTLTPTAADDVLHGIEFDYLGRHYTATRFDDNSGAQTATLICNDLRTALGTITGLTFGGTTTLTITTAAGTAIENLRRIGDGAFTSITETTPADVDAIDASTIASFETSAGAGELVLVRVFRGASA